MALRTWDRFDQMLPSADAPEATRRELTIREVAPPHGVLMRMTFSQDCWRRLAVSSGRFLSTAGDDEAVADKSERYTLDELEPYGLQYGFSLFDESVPDGGEGVKGSAAVQAPEWLVFQGVGLAELLRRHGLELHTLKNFHEYCHSAMHTSSQRCSFRSMAYRVP